MIKINNIKASYLFIGLLFSTITYAQTTLPPDVFGDGNQQIPIVAPTKQTNYTYVARSGIPQTNADSKFNSKASTLRLFEIWPDGSTKELGPSHSPHVDINKLGGGRFSHWNDTNNNSYYLLFSASDATDPRSNGRSYLAVLPGVATTNDKVGSIYDSQTNTRKFYLGTSDPQHRTIAITNPSSYSYTFGLALNQNAFLQSNADLKTEIQSLIPDFANEPIERKIWRFARDNRIHGIPYTNYLWYHHPLILFNSAGFGFCDDVASAIVHIGANFNILGRVTSLNSSILGGHIVSELLANGNWHLYDGDYQTYFFDTLGTNNVASVSSIISDVSLITTPVQSTDWAPIKSSLVLSPARYATLYNTAAKVEPWYSLMPLTEAALRFDLPPGGTVEIGGHDVGNAPTTFEGNIWSTQPKYSSVKVSLPEGSIGDLQVFLIPYLIKGNGSATLTFQDGSVKTIPVSSTTNWNVNDKTYRANFIKKISYVVGSGGMDVYYLANPIRSSVRGFNSVVLNPVGNESSQLVNPLDVKLFVKP